MFLGINVFFVVFYVALACVVGIAGCCCFHCIIAVLYAVAKHVTSHKLLNFLQSVHAFLCQFLIDVLDSLSASFELLRKERQKVFQETQKSNPDLRKNDFDFTEKQVEVMKSKLSGVRKVMRRR